MVFKRDIFLCLQFICCVFCSELQSENMRDSVQRGDKKWSSIEILFFAWILFSGSNLGLISKATTWKKEGLQNLFNLLF